MSLADIANVQITANTVTPTRAGFGTMLFMGQGQAAGVMEEYASYAEVLEAGYASTSAVARAATRFFSQSPRPRTMKVFGRTTLSRQSIEIRPLSAVEGTVYDFTIFGARITRTVPGSSSVNAEATAIAAAIEASAIGAIVTASAASGVVTVILTAAGGGDPLDYTDIVNPATELDFRDVTADGDIADQLAAALLLDTDWYLVAIDSSAPAEIEEAAAWTEANGKLLVWDIIDTPAMDAAVTTDTPSDLADAEYARTYGQYSREIGVYNTVGLASGRLADDPGSDTWAFKTIRGAQPDILTTTQKNALEGKNVNHYQTLAGVAITRNGVSASGEYIDITRGIDWLTARIQERIFRLLVNNRKLPYTDASVDLVRAEILAQLDEAVQIGFINPDFPILVTAPKVADVDPVDRANRLLPDVEFSATLAGAIHRFDPIRGTLSV